ncbi:MAG: hypothetical protein V1858_03910 [Candidatus Gottesmanbacteria bacterium]
MIFLDSIFIKSFLTNTLFFFWFIAASILAFYIPADIVLGKRLSSLSSILEKISIRLSIGLVLWAYQTIIFGYLKLRFLSYLYIILFLIIWFHKKFYLSINIKEFFKLKTNYLLLLVFILGIFGQVLQFLPLGFKFTEGIYSTASANDDALWHAALTTQIINRYPPFEPGLAGVEVHNYHYWANIVMGDFIRVFKLPIMPTIFIYFSLFLSFLLGGVSYVLGKILNFSKVGIIIFVYLQYFSSDIIYLLIMFTRHTLDFTVQPLEAGTMFLENPPRAFSIIVALSSIVLLVSWLRKQDRRILIVLILLSSSIIGFKVNTGIMVLGGFCCLSLYYLFRKNFNILIITISIIILSLLIYLPVNRNSGTLFYAPFEMSRMFAVQPNINLSRLELARRIYESNFNYFQARRMDLMMLTLFLISEFGVRNLGWLPLRVTLISIGYPLLIFLYGGIFMAIFLGTFFYQTTGGANIFNFYLAASLFLSILSVPILSQLIQSKKSLIKAIIIILLLLSTQPRWISSVSSYYESFLYVYREKRTVLDTSELEALNFINKNTEKNSIIMVVSQGLHPAVFTQRNLFLAGKGILESHVVPFKSREEVVEIVLFSPSAKIVKETLKNNQIDYLLFNTGQPSIPAGFENVSLKKVFQNKQNTVFKFSN